MPLYLNVPFSEKDEAKSLGARWDAQAKKWFVPDEVKSSPFAKWLPQEAVQQVMVAPVYLRTSVERCWKCGVNSYVYCLGASSINDVEYDDEDDEPYIFSVDNDKSLVDLCDLDEVDHRLFIVLKDLAPKYRPDYSSTKKSRCWMNHCEHCDAKLGDFYLHGEPGGAFFPLSDNDSTITDTLLFQSGDFTFSGGYSLKGAI